MEWTHHKLDAGREAMIYYLDLPEIYDAAVKPEHVEGNTMYCEPLKTKGEWARQIGGAAVNAFSSFMPF